MFEYSHKVSSCWKPVADDGGKYVNMPLAVLQWKLTVNGKVCPPTCPVGDPFFTILWKPAKFCKNHLKTYSTDFREVQVWVHWPRLEISCFSLFPPPTVLQNVLLQHIQENTSSLRTQIVSFVIFHPCFLNKTAQPHNEVITGGLQRSLSSCQACYPWWG